MTAEFVAASRGQTVAAAVTVASPCGNLGTKLVIVYKALSNTLIDRISARHKIANKRNKMTIIILGNLIRHLLAPGFIVLTLWT